MAVIRDIDFLLAARSSDPLPMDRPLVYRYRSGALRPRMLAAFRQIAERHDLMLGVTAPPLSTGYARSVSWFNHLQLVDWPARTSRAAGSDHKNAPLTAGALDESLGLLAAYLDVPGIHFVEHGSKVGRHPLWCAVEHGALVVEEPAITRESLRPILRYLAATTDLVPDADFLERREFFESFVDLIEERADLPAVIQAFEERVLLCIDPETNHTNGLRH